jgi:two-component sensor histidine kinase
MSLIHENLYRDGVFADIDFSEYIPLLVNKLSVAYNNPAVSTEFEMEKIRLNMDSAIPCGLILNELVSNCYKYAFPGGRMGRISIKLFAEKESGRCALIVHDNGAGFPDSIDFNNPDSLGILMINMLVYQLNGEIRLTKENGTEFKISFPL